MIPPATLSALRAVLVAAPFTPAALRDMWGVDVDDALTRNNAAPARWFLRRRASQHSASLHGASLHGAAEVPSPPGTPLAVLASLFVLAEPVDRQRLSTLLGEDLLAALVDAGLLVPADTADLQGASGAGDHTALRSVLALGAYPVPVGVPRGEAAGDDHLYLFSDFGTLVTDGPLDGGFVLGIGGAGRTLADITPRHRVDRALDLGTGCGIQALLLARHAGHVVATDVSARALDITRLNAGLEGVALGPAGEGHLELRPGSMFEPVPETFDLVVANPPFVITPQGHTETLEYRDGGAAGDGIVRTLLEGTRAHLSPDGEAVYLGNWEVGGDRTGPETWPAGDDLTVMVVERESMSPVQYAETWIRDGGVVRAGRRWETDHTAWLDDFTARDVEEITFGWIRLHRMPEPGAVSESGEGTTGAVARAPRHREVITGALGANPAGTAAYLDMRLGLLEWVERADDAELLGTAFLRSPDVVEHRHLVPGDENPTVITLDQGAGFARSFEADPALAGLVGVADGSLTLGAVVVALAHLLEVEESALTAQLLDQVRRLVPAGVLLPAGE